MPPAGLALLTLVELMLPVANPLVVYKPVSEGAVLLHSGTEVYFGLNPVGARIWELLPPVCRTLDQLCAVLHQSYPTVELDALRQDVTEILDDLVGHGLLIVNREGAGVGSDASAA
jgi:hypothetical protein